MLRIALPNKGRLAEEARELFTDAGLEVRAAGPRALTASLGGEFQALFVRAQDIPEFVADGAADAGVTGWDLVRESGRDLDELADLDVRTLPPRRRGDARRAASRPLERIVDRHARGDRLPAPHRGVLRRRAGSAVEVVPVSGAAEIAPHLGIADVIVDLMSTGSTLRVNGLREVATVLESTARLIAAPGTRARRRARRARSTSWWPRWQRARRARQALRDGERAARARSTR